MFKYRTRSHLLTFVMVITITLVLAVSSFAGGRAESMPEAPLVVWVDEARGDIMREVGNQFSAEFGVDVLVETMGFGEIRDDLEVAGPVGEGPDIFIGAHDWLGQLVNSGLVAPMDLGAEEADFLPAAVDAYRFGGDLYGMPYQMDNVALLRNPNLVPEAPRTFTELTDIARDLQESGQVTFGFIRQEGDPYHFFPILTAFGGYVFGEGPQGYIASDVGIDSPGGIAAAEWLEQLVAEGMMTDGISPAIMDEMFINGETAMMIAGPWVLPTMRENDVEYEIDPIPSETSIGRPFLGVQGFMISAFSEQRLLAQTFLTDFVATTNVMLQLFEAVPRPVVHLPSAALIDDPDVNAFAAAGETGAPMPAIPEMSAVWEAWNNAIILITQGRSSGSEAFTTAADQIRAAIEE